MKTNFSIFQSSILTRLWLVFGLLYFLSVSFVGYLVFHAEEDELLASSSLQSNHRSELAKLEFKSLLFGAERDISLLSSSPSLRRFIETSNDENLNELSSLFEKYLSTRSEYFQVRFLSALDGKELLRLDKRHASISRTPDSLLQEKSSRGYFNETIKLNEGEFYFSEINLNQEFNKVSQPEIVTLRAASPVFTKGNELAGIVVINIELKNWIEKINAISSNQNALLIIKDNGEYVSHPNSDLVLGLDKANGHLSDLDLEILDPETEFSRAVFQEEEVYLSKASLEYNSVPSRSLNFVDILENETLFTSIIEKRRQIMGQGIIILILGLLLIYLLAKSLTRPLLRMQEEISSSMEAGDISLSEVDRKDEIGTLAKSFERLAQELKQKADNAEKLSEEKENFVASFSHELRTPLNSIMGMTEVLMQNDPSPKQEGVLKTLKYAVHNLRALIGDVLDSSKIASGSIQIREEAVVLKELAQNLVLSYTQEADRKGIKLGFEIDSELPDAVLSDYLRLYQVLNNLISNAVKFTETGFVNLKISKDSKAQILFEVIDSGPGIRQEDQELILKKYQQTNLGKNKAQGLGLGLSISSELLTLMNSNLKIHSSEGNGSVFSFSIVLKVINAATESEKQTKIKAAKILYVDDIAINRFTLSQLLEAEPIEILEAESCESAAEILKVHQVDVVIMDLKMPKVDGFDCIQKLRELGSYEFIALSANLGDVEIARLEGLGVTYALEKPLIKGDLLRILELILDEKSKYFRSLKLFFDTNSESKVLKAMRLLTDELKLTLETLNSEQDLSESQLADIRHKLKPSLEIINLKSLLEQEPKSLAMAIDELIQELEAELQQRQGGQGTNLES